MIRKITEEDKQGTFNLVKEFQEEALNKTKVSFNEITLLARIDSAIKHDMPTIFVAVENDIVVGLLSGLIVNSYFDTNQILALELMWYVSKQHRGASAGKKLMEEFEKYAKEKGAENVIMIAGHYSINEKKDMVLDHFYKKNGYIKLETHYIKSLRS